jgi:DNA-directed RNA polymerase specialized sigma24 family protein
MKAICAPRPTPPPGACVTPKALLVRIAENLASNRRRDRYYEVAQDTGELTLEKQSIGPCQEQAVTFKQIVLALPDELRDVFMLNHVQGMTYEEIAVLPGHSADDGSPSYAHGLEANLKGDAGLDGRST